MSDLARRSGLVVVFATVCVDLLGFGLVMPLLPLYGKALLADRPADQAGWTLALLMISFSAMQFLFAPLWGRVSDRVGRRPVLLASLAASTVFYAMFGVAALQQSLGAMFAARIGAGIASATIPTAQAYIADITPRARRARGMALIGAAFGLGFTLGPLIGALAMEIGGVWRDHGGLSPWPGYLAAVLSAIALTMALFRLPESHDPTRVPETRKHIDWQSLRQALVVPSIGPLLGASFLAVFSLASFEGTISLAIDAKLAEPTMPPPSAFGTAETESPPARLFFVFAYIGVIQCLVQGVLVRRIAGRVSDAWLAAVGGVIAVVGFGLLALSVQPVVLGTAFLMVASAVLVTGIAFVFPAVQSLLSRRSDPAEQGGILGAQESVGAIARIVGVAFGVRTFRHAPALPYWSAATMMAVALLLALLAARIGRDWESPEPDS